MVQFIEGFADSSGDVLVYHFNRETGELLGKGLVHVSEGCGLAPGQTLDAPPRVRKGHVAVRRGEQWLVVKPVTLYRTDTGEEDGQGWGEEIPDGMTDQARPSIHHRWSGSEWVLDQQALAAHEQAAAVAEAMAYLSSTDWYVIRQQETGKAVPAEVLERRQKARLTVGGGHV